MPNTFKVSEVLTIIKKKLHIARDQQQGIVLLADGKFLMKHDSPLTDIYERHKDSQDGFLYIIYAEEQVYGGEFWSIISINWVNLRRLNSDLLRGLFVLELERVNLS